MVTYTDKRPCAALFKSSFFAKKNVKFRPPAILLTVGELSVLSDVFCPRGNKAIRNTLCPLSRSLVEHRGQNENTLPKGNWKKMFENQKYYLLPVGNFREFLGTFRSRSKKTSYFCLIQSIF